MKGFKMPKEECPNFTECIHPLMSLHYYENSCADPADNARKMFVNWTQQLGLCQACLQDNHPEDSVT